ncbi:MAG: hypothetical protein P9L88_05385 [Candidatus Tantalella remota]|nr:hypothetical protein [Candidatus Tantalella remota]
MCKGIISAVLILGILMACSTAFADDEYMTDSGEIGEVSDGEIMTDSGQLEEVGDAGEYMTDSGEIRDTSSL